METQPTTRQYYTGNGDRYGKAQERIETQQGNIWTERLWWRRSVFALLVVVAVLIAGLVAVAMRPSHVPVYIKVDAEGHTQIFTYETYEPTTDEIKKDLIRWMRCVREIPTDEAVLEYCWRIVPLFLLEKTQAMQTVQKYYKALNPKSLLFKKRIWTDNMSAVREPDGRWRMRWVESTYGFQRHGGVGKLETSTEMSAVLTLTRRKPTTEKEIRLKGEPVNPRGVYLLSLGWGE